MRRIRMLFLLVITALFIILGGCTQTSNETKKEVTVSAAASLSDVMNEITRQFSKKTGIKVNVNLASSGSLEKQIEEGAPSDLFFSASKNYMERLVQKGMVNKKDVVPLLTNQLVLIVPADTTNVQGFNDLKNVKRIAIGTPEIVPAGHYAEESLKSLELWPSILQKLVYAKDVRQVLSYVETGNVDAGLVYKSDALISEKVKIIKTAPSSSHEPIVYPCAVIKTSAKNEAVQNLFHYLQSDSARKVFKKYGFEPLKKDNE